jgi:hypothetical protein
MVGLGFMIYTYHRIVEGCVAREAGAWREFVRRYLPLARHLLFHYAPERAGREGETAVFRAALQDDARFFRSFSGHTERELLVHFRAFVLEQTRRRGAGNAAAQPSAPEAAAGGGAAHAPVITLETLRAALKDFTALQRQQVWMYMQGYSPEQTALLLGSLKPQTVSATLSLAQEKLREAMDAWSEDSLRASGPALAEEVTGMETKDCYPYLAFNRILDGQIAWRDREQTLGHMKECFRCVARFCEVQEMLYVQRTAPAAVESDVEAVLQSVGMEAAPAPAQKKSLLARLFG